MSDEKAEKLISTIKTSTLFMAVMLFSIIMVLVSISMKK